MMIAEEEPDAIRRFAPDYVSAETLAYRLDCSRATIDAYVRKGLLPKPERIGNMVRWDFAAVKAFIKGRNDRPAEVGLNGRQRDVYLERLKSGTAT